MDTQTLSPVAAAGNSARTAVVAYLGAAAFIVATAWNALAIHGVTVASAPHAAANVPADQAMRGYYRWVATTVGQEQLYSAIAIAGFACLAAVAVLARQVLDRDDALAGAGAVAVGAGAATWVAGSLIELGGHRAIGLMATHINPIQVTNSISFTIDTIVQAFDLAAFALLSAGMLAFARVAIRRGRRGWAACTLVLALIGLLAAWSYAAGNGDLTEAVLLAGGLAAMPAWLIWTARLVPAGPSS
jgi:hypothetical protein